MSNFEDLIKIKKLEKKLYDNNNKLKFLEQANDKLIEQKKQLKKLLKECKELIDNHIIGEYAIELCERIINAIGEKK